jgi:molecular chaperone GrpE
VKVPIDVENDELREDDVATEETTEAVESEAVDFEELTPEEEAAMVEAAKRAGAEAAEADLAAEAEAEVSELQSQLDAALAEAEAAKKEAADASDRLLRLQAEWENYRRRTAQERLAERERAAERLATNLLPVLDDMERASSHATQTAEGDEKVAQFVDGVMAVHAKMLDILGKESVEIIDPAGEPFDPLVHQAVGRQEDTEAYDETVAQVYQKGYRMGGKVIRPAMVTVTFGGPKRPAEEPEAEEE